MLLQPARISLEFILRFVECFADLTAVPQSTHHLDDGTLVAKDEICYLVAGQTKELMKLELYTDAMLTVDLPDHRLRRGDIVKLVDHHIAPDRTEGYSIEVFNALGETIAVTAVPATALEALREDAI